MNKKLKISYEIIFTTLAIIAVVITFLDIIEKINLDTNVTLSFIDNTITYIFIFDYFIRLIIAPNKKTFFRKNIPDLIAIVPFNSFFKIFRIAKLFRLAKFGKIFKLFRFIGVGGRLHKRIKHILQTNGLNYALWFTLLVISLGSIGIYIVEKGKTINDFSDAIWWSFVTATTVGYGDISPATKVGRIIAACLMLTGIGTLGMITGSISTYFISRKDNNIEEKYPEKTAEFLIKHSNDLSNDEKDKIIDFICYLKQKRND